MKLFTSLSIFTILLLSACSIGENLGDQQDGMVWEEYTDAPITAGFEMDAGRNYLYFADANSNIYKMNANTGTIFEKKKITETPKMLYMNSADSYLYVVSVSSSATYIKRFDSDLTMDSSYAVTNTGFIAKDGYFIDSGNIVVHSTNSIHSINLTSGIYSTLTLLSESNIMSVVKGDYPYYYVISDRATIYPVNSSTFISGTSYSLNSVFQGSAIYQSPSLYIGTYNTGGIYSIPSTLGSASLLISTSVASAPFLVNGNSFFAGFSPASKFGSYNIASSLSQNWTTTPSGAVTFSPLALSLSTGTISFVDDGGNLNVLNMNTGALLVSKSIGTINRPNLKITQDYYGKFIFIPVSVPSKVTCYSVDYAAKPH